jgi:hypothetical protein
MSNVTTNAKIEIQLYGSDCGLLKVLKGTNMFLG